MQLNVRCPCCNEPLSVDVETISVIRDELTHLEDDSEQLLNEWGIEFG